MNAADKEYALKRAGRNILIYPNRDAAPINLCPVHRSGYFSTYPESFGSGEWNDDPCKYCESGHE